MLWGRARASLGSCSCWVCAKSVKDGLERLSEGSGLPEAYEPQPEPLHVLAEAVQALHGEIQALRGEVATLREDNEMLRQQLKPLEPPKEVKRADVAAPDQPDPAKKTKWSWFLRWWQESRPLKRG